VTLSSFTCREQCDCSATTVTWCSMRVKITWSAKHRRSMNTICTAPAQDCERSENPISYLYIRHHRYDIYRYHKNRQIIVINELNFRTVVLHSHGTSVSYIGLNSLSLLVQPLNATSLRFTLLLYVITSKLGHLFIPTKYHQGGNSFHPYKWSYLIMHYSVYEWIWKS